MASIFCPLHQTSIVSFSAVGNKQTMRTADDIVVFDLHSVFDLQPPPPPPLTQHHAVVQPVHLQQPGLGALGAVVDELLQALAVDLQRVLVGEAADGLDVHGGSGVGSAHRERLLPHQLEHPVLPDHFLPRDGETERQYHVLRRLVLSTNQTDIQFCFFFMVKERRNQEYSHITC